MKNKITFYTLTTISVCLIFTYLAITNWLSIYLSFWYDIIFVVWVIIIYIIENKINKSENTQEIIELSDNVYTLLAQNIILENINNHKDPIIIYTKVSWDSWSDVEKLIFWNKSMEKFTWYKFEEVRSKDQNEIMQLLYWHDQKELDKILTQLNKLDKRWIWDSDLVFLLRTKEWRIKPIAWRTEKKYWWWIISYWSIEQVEIQKVLRKDPAFNCLNVTALNEDFNKILSSSRDSDSQIYPNTLSFVFWDIDFFKKFNDTYWHKMWDAVLEYVIAFLKFEFRRDWDWIYRKWWDEFVVLCDKTSEKNTYEKIEKVRLRLACTNIVATYNNWELRTSYIKHTSPEFATKYFNNEEVQKQNERILQDMWMKKNEKWEIKTWNTAISWILILPPIWTTWWVVEYNYDKWQLSKKSLKEIQTEIVDSADKLMYNGKKHSKWVVFTKEIVDGLPKK